MWPRSLLKSLKSRPSVATFRHSLQRSRASRLAVEALDERCLPSFASPVDYPVAGGVWDVVTADFNGDGRLDVATSAGYPESKISVLLGNGDGTFQPVRTSPGDAGYARSLAVGDFNGDGKPDLVNEGGVHLGNGDGTFGSGLGLNSTWYLGWIAAGDLNADGKDDLVGVNWGWDGSESGGDYGLVEAWLGNGDGTFASSWSIWASGEPASVALADFNGDGKLDVSAGGTVLLGNGDGTLLGGPGYGLGDAISVGVADFNGDGKLDQAKISSSLGMAIMLGNGDSTFHLSWLDSGGGTGYIALADFNGDGKVDLAKTYNGLEIYLGNGDGTLRTPPTHPDAHLGDVVVAADFNGDGFPDLATNPGYNTISVLVNAANWPPLNDPSVSVSDATVTEGNTGSRAATFIVTLSAAYSQPVKVNYATANGTATAGSDYQAASGTLTFAPGETSKTVTIWVNGDRLAEPNETFSVNLSSPTNAVINDGQGVGTILDDEPRISISDITKAEGKKNQTTLFTFTVTLSAAYDQAVTMSYKTTDGTAKTSDQDYVSKTGTLTFAPGETTKTITIEVKGDSKKEADEDFYLDLFGNSTNSLLTKSRGAGTILNDD